MIVLIANQFPYTELDHNSNVRVYLLVDRRVTVLAMYDLVGVRNLVLGCCPKAEDGDCGPVFPATSKICLFPVPI